MEIPGYQLGRELAMGDRCSLFSALELESSKTVTIKVYRAPQQQQKAFCDHIESLSSHLQHRQIGHLIPLKQLIIESGYCYLITDYLPCVGEECTLERVSDFQQLLNIGEKIAQTLQLLHQQGIVHGAISRYNLSIKDQQLVIGLCAFQRSFDQQHLTADDKLEETDADSLAPEYFNQAMVPASDYFALGVLLFELAFGRKPYPADSSKNCLLKKIHEEIDFPHEVGSAEKNLLLKLLRANSDKRISNLSEYQNAVSEAGFKLLPVKETPNLESPSTSVTSKSNLIWVVPLVLLILGIAGFLLFSMTDSQPDDRGATTASSQPYVDINATPEISEITTNPSATPSPDEPQLSASEINTALQQAQQLLSEGKPGRALITINQLTKQIPNNDTANTLKTRIEKELQIQNQLNLATRYMEQGFLSEPAGQNAIETLHNLQTQMPQQDNRAQQLLGNIAGYFEQQANQHLQQDQLEQAQLNLDKGLKASPNSPELTQLQQQLNARRQQLDSEQKLALEQQQREQSRIETLKKQAAAEQQAKLQLEKQQQQLLIEQQQKEKQRIEEQRLQQRARQNDIEQKTRQAQEILADANSVEELRQVENLLDGLQQLQAPADSVQQITRKVSEVYSELSNQSLQNNQLETALEINAAGLKFAPQDATLSQQKQRIELQIQQRDQEQQAVPFFGTF